MHILKVEKEFTRQKEVKGIPDRGKNLHKGFKTWKGLESWKNGEKFNGAGTMGERQTWER